MASVSIPMNTKTKAMNGGNIGNTRGKPLRNCVVIIIIIYWYVLYFNFIGCFLLGS